ncbi:hypothetical protein H6G33_10670 [Calothrix sp. FACHB-1219]|uniref:hypothetical protein n=1 Tax=unclassified Calothrix TaxID=2619626 RepID=UPI0016879760|nr:MULTISPECIES: hypothetical protein [unclassified Calothrix]MBD2201811.1 hypothetical protein [Calothrix sp. FACHB-168]MBD2217497.1 hypothetical protein [Calothrix sp. FACHB-1219]
MKWVLRWVNGWYSYFFDHPQDTGLLTLFNKRTDLLECIDDWLEQDELHRVSPPEPYFDPDNVLQQTQEEYELYIEIYAEEHGLNEEGE